MKLANANIHLGIIVSQPSASDLYPNPTTDQLYFSQEFSALKLLDITGKVVLVVSEPSNQINVENLAARSYIVLANTMNGEQRFARFFVGMMLMLISNGVRIKTYFFRLFIRLNTVFYLLKFR